MVLTVRVRPCVSENQHKFGIARWRYAEKIRPVLGLFAYRYREAGLVRIPRVVGLGGARQFAEEIARCRCRKGAQPLHKLGFGVATL